MAPMTSADLKLVHFKVAGLTAFDLEVEDGTSVSDLKKAIKEESNIEPEHMRLLCNDQVLKDLNNVKSDDTIQVLFTAGHEGLVGGGQRGMSGGSTGQPGERLRGQTVQQSNPFTTPVRGIPGSKGLRGSRVSGRRGGMGIIRKYGILMKRQEFREKAEEIGFVKYR